MDINITEISHVIFVCPECKTEIAVSIKGKGSIRACPFCAALLEKATATVFELLIDTLQRAELINGELKIRVNRC